jgi:hypothetical protein
MNTFGNSGLLKTIEPPPRSETLLITFRILWMRNWEMNRPPPFTGNDSPGIPIVVDFPKALIPFST